MLSANPQKTCNNKIEMIDNKSAIIGINPSEKISLMDSMSFMVRVVKVPIGVLSNCERL